MRPRPPCILGGTLLLAAAAVVYRGFRKRVRLLRMNEDRFRAVFQNAAVGIVETERDDHIVGVNQRVCDMLGYRAEELLSMNIHQLTAPEDRELSDSTNRQIHTGELVRSAYDKRYLKRDGSRLWVHVTVSAMRDEEGRWLRSVGTVEDITDRKLAQEERRRQREEFERISAEKEKTLAMLNAMIEHAPVSLAMFDREIRYMNVSRRWINDFFDGRDDLIGKSQYDVLPDLPERYLEAHRRALAGEIVTAEEDVYPRPDGSMQWLRWEVRPWHDPDGTIGGIIIFIEDITARKEAEHALRYKEELLRKVLETLPVGVWIINRQGTIVQGNRAALDVWGGARYVGPEQYGEYKGWHLDTGRMIQTEEWAAARAIRNGETTVGEELEIESFDGIHKIILNFAAPLRDEDATIIGAIIVNQDITRRKRAEEELRRAKDELEVRVRERTRELSQALDDLRLETTERFLAVEELRRNEQMLVQQGRMAAMGEMLGNIAHQWKQPLNVLGLLLQEVLMTCKKVTIDRESLEKTVARGREVIGHMSETVDDFRSFLSPEKAKGKFYLDEVVQKAVTLVQESLKGIRVNISAPESVAVEGYRNELAQVVINIVSNARDVLRERGIEEGAITISIFTQDGRGIVTIADNAGGIPQDIIGKVFDPYFTTKSAEKGTGIGLFMSKTIIEKNMGGRLTVRNTGDGAEFKIEV